MNGFECFLITAIGISIGLTFLMVYQTVSAVNIDGTWKLNANAEKADLTIKVSPTGQIKGTFHTTKTDPTSRPYTSNIFGFWDNVSMKIVFLKENKIVFDNPNEPEESCNTVQNITKEPCHGRDVAFTGYLFGGPPSGGFTNPLMMAGVEQAFAGSEYPGGGVGANAQRNTYGWCATFEVDMCGPPVPTINPAVTSNMSTTAK